jgi:epsilon-lactone hydrolase
MNYAEACAAARVAGAAALAVDHPGYFSETRAGWVSRARPIPDHVERIEHTLGGVPVLTLGAASPRRAILYLHGGGYTFGGVASHGAWASEIAAVTGRQVHIVDYRLAPEHPAPAALEDVLAVFSALGQPPILMGDSAGGGLALVAATQATTPAVVTFSAWTDLTGARSSMADNAERDAVLKADRLHAAALVYAGINIARADVSPIFGPRPDAPMLMHVCADELLLDDTLDYARGNAATSVMVWAEALHAWHIFGDRLPDGRDALAATARFLERHAY